MKSSHRQLERWCASIALAGRLATSREVKMATSLPQHHRRPQNQYHRVCYFQRLIYLYPGENGQDGYPGKMIDLAVIYQTFLHEEAF